MWLKKVLYSKIKIKKFVHVCDIELNRWPIIHCSKSKGSFISTKNENDKNRVHSIQYRGLIGPFLQFAKLKLCYRPWALLELGLSRLRELWVELGLVKMDYYFVTGAHLIRWTFASLLVVHNTGLLFCNRAFKELTHFNYF